VHSNGKRRRRRRSEGPGETRDNNGASNIKGEGEHAIVVAS
jgi:hypothetical protein